MQQPARIPYQPVLRALGWHLDQSQQRQILILEADNSYMLRGLVHGPNGPVTTHTRLNTTDLLALIGRQQANRSQPAPLPATPAVCLTGYEDFLRTVGQLLDIVGASDLRIAELSSTILISYTTADERNAPERIDEVYDQRTVDQLVTRSFRNRTSNGRPIAATA